MQSFTFGKDLDIQKIVAKDSDIRKIRIGGSFEYLSHLQKILTFKRFNSNFFPNLSNVLNILLTSLFFANLSNVLNILLTSLALRFAISQPFLKIETSGLDQTII